MQQGLGFRVQGPETLNPRAVIDPAAAWTLASTGMIFDVSTLVLRREPGKI